METEQTRPYAAEPPPPPRPGGAFKKALGPLAVLGVLLLKFKSALIPLLKFFPLVLKTGGTMFITIWLYAMFWGWWFALGFVLLIFVHECGHLIAAKMFGLRVGAPVFIPFMGAFIALKEAPRNAWIEAVVGIGGPILGTVGAAACYFIAQLTGNPMFSALAYVGCLLNLFNLMPVGFLDGGRIATALSPWLWVIGTAILGGMIFVQVRAGGLSIDNPTLFILIFVFMLSLPRLFSLFRPRSPEEQRYFEVTPVQRWAMGFMYFGLIILLVFGMAAAHVPMDRPE